MSRSANVEGVLALLALRTSLWWRRSTNDLVPEHHVDACSALDCAVVTAEVRHRRADTRSVISVEVRFDCDDGVPEECAVSLDNLGVVPKRNLTERVCALAPDRLAQVCEALAVAVDC